MTLPSRLGAIDDADRRLLVVDRDVERLREPGDRTLGVARGRVPDRTARGAFLTTPQTGDGFDGDGRTPPGSDPD